MDGATPKDIIGMNSIQPAVGDNDHVERSTCRKHGELRQRCKNGKNLRMRIELPMGDRPYSYLDLRSFQEEDCCSVCGYCRSLDGASGANSDLYNSSGET